MIDGGSAGVQQGPDISTRKERARVQRLHRFLSQFNGPIELQDAVGAIFELPLKEISRITGVPYGTIAWYKNKYTTGQFSIENGHWLVSHFFDIKQQSTWTAKTLSDLSEV